MTKLMENNNIQKRTTLNQTSEEEGATLSGDLHNEKRRNIIKWGLIGGAVFLVVLLAIVLPIALSGKGGVDPVDPVEPVRPPVAPNSTNEYFTDQSAAMTTPFSLSGQILLKKPEPTP